MAPTPDLAVIALQRFGLGLTLTNRQAIADDPRGACLEEIGPSRAIIPHQDLLDTARAIQVFTQFEDGQREIRERARLIAQHSLERPPDAMPAIAPPMPQTEPSRLNEHVFQEVKARFSFGMEGRVGFHERWAQFWSNHFAIGLRRGGILRVTAGPYEREAIRPHVFGPFETLLIAAETHPAMLHYLDQRQSIGPNSPVGRRQKRGLNENLAREIIELHTLGVNGGYTQADVTSFARILTGWSITNRAENLAGSGGFDFVKSRHEPGAQVVLGKTYPDTGKEQGLAVLTDLARHPATAKFLATKIARHFVADTPPPSLVGKLEDAYRRSEGDLARVASTLLSADEAWQAPSTKLRTPSQFLMASYRALGALPERPQQIVNHLNLMGQPLWDPPGPNGHPDDEASLAAPKAIKTRMDIALQLARPMASRMDPRKLAVDLFGPSLSAETRRAIAQAETHAFGLALFLLSPEFNRV